MKLKNFQLLETERPKGGQIVLDFGKYHLSIINDGYGSDKGLYEIAAFDACDGVARGMTELPGITAEGDTVQGYLTEADVDAIIYKLYTITGTEATQI